MNKQDALMKVLKYYGLLNATSGKYKIVCPFHADINASLQINIDDGFFHCYGCKRQGDALEFVRYANPNIDALNIYAEYYKILNANHTKNIQYNLDNKVSKKQIIADKRHYMDMAMDYYYGLKTENWEGINHEVKDYIINRGYTVDSLNKAKAKLTYNKIYPIVFPLNDMGNFKGWVSRTSSKKVEKIRKYLYNTGFTRTETIVGRYDNNVVMLTEGYFDYLKMKQFDVKYVGAILGWKISSSQIMKLKEKGVKTIISALDTDECGNKGTEELKNYFNVIRFEFPRGVKDPGDLTYQKFLAANIKTKKKYREAKENGFIK